ncbi:MAG TPA: 3-phosphoshikimate 1-carboxyvinyltransferase, partial [Salinimicrobium sp.]|nr:3-phosphoshikimate 1-carboxyvinyltransferase [Salinimicrobium sp.]
RVILTGSSRMSERPIEILVNALRELGAEISYLQNPGFPPLLISGTDFISNEVSLPANVSSQYISALMLIAPALPKGLIINLEGSVTSLPYIEMTLRLLQELGIEAIFKNQKIVVSHKVSVISKTIEVESDWSSASYFYGIAALSTSAEIRINSFKKESLQGDATLSNIYGKLGVKTSFEGNMLVLKRIPTELPQTLKLDLNKTPDIAQTIAVTCLGLGIGCRLTGLHTLKIKETDRLMALKNEIEKFGAEVFVDENSLSFSEVKNLKNRVKIETYNDHRMAMAFAALSIKTEVLIENPEVVSKSYPKFWDHLKALDFQLEK